MQITEHFNTDEFACLCGTCGEDGRGISHLLLYTLEDIRNLYGKPMPVNSGLRCPKHNKAVGGATNSRHLPRNGDAADIKVGTLEDRDRLVAIAKEKGCSVGVGTSFVHIDVRPGKPRTWYY